LIFPDIRIFDDYPGKRQVIVDALDEGIERMHVDKIRQRVEAQMGWGVSKKTISNNLTNLVRGKTPRLKRVGTQSGTYRVNDYWLRITRSTQT